MAASIEVSMDNMAFYAEMKKGVQTNIIHIRRDSRRDLGKGPEDIKETQNTAKEDEDDEDDMPKFSRYCNVQATLYTTSLLLHMFSLCFVVGVGGICRLRKGTEAFYEMMGKGARQPPRPLASSLYRKSESETEQDLGKESRSSLDRSDSFCSGEEGNKKAGERNPRPESKIMTIKVQFISLPIFPDSD